jgi:hypothetical protein
MLFRITAVLFCIVGVSLAEAADSCSILPESVTYKGGSNTKLPNPFQFLNGSKVNTKSDWSCRRDEIRAVFQRYELGPMPPTPTITASMAPNKLSINITASSGKSISFSVSVKYPSGSGPFPALIALGGASIPVPASVAVITYNNEEIAATDPRGKGKFYDLYGSGHKAGGLIAWAWGVARIMDALEKLGPGSTKINAAKVAVTGCSRNGKGAMMAGAFDDRIQLTIPQEAGSGGMGCWRIVGEMKRNGTKVEDAAQIVNGDGWFSTDFSSVVDKLEQLPEDHHMLAGLIAPRPLLVIENSGIDYLGPISTFGCATAARIIYEALGAADTLGFSQTAHGSSHCQLPSNQNADVAAFFNTYLLDQATANTKIFKTDKTYAFDLVRWVDWVAPALS